MPQAEIALLTNEIEEDERTPEPEKPEREAAEGAFRMLLELKQQFHIVDAGADLSDYRVLVLADLGNLTSTMSEKMGAFIVGGGAVIATHEAPLNESNDGFALPELGVDYCGLSEWPIAYVHVDGGVPDGIADYDYGIHEQGSAVELRTGTEVLARLSRPYFNRTWREFLSHAQTPRDQATDWPAATQIW